ncbi:hypothetical protein CI102_14284 [Trichoderma harzianum]|nr:hypothetical protein CI102_14284 [Trichoderma harzianum]
MGPSAVTAEGFIRPERGGCGICGRETSRRCQACSLDWFCSQECQDQMSFNHLTLCSARSITTADKLWHYAVGDRIPQDSETREHFGFTRCRGWRDESQLLGLYQGLIRVLGIQAIQLNEWRERDILHILNNLTSPLQPTDWQISSQFDEDWRRLEVAENWRTLATVVFAFFFYFLLYIVVFRIGINAIANLIWGLLDFCLNSNLVWGLLDLGLFYYCMFIM